MSIAETLLPEFDLEMGNARRILERVPDGQLSWQPHPRSMTLGRLAEHVSEVPGWVVRIFKHDEWDLAAGNAGPGRGAPSDAASILEQFDRSLEEGRNLLVAAADEEFDQTWTLRRGEQVFFTLPKSVVYRRWVISHLVHHRAQLGVFLRMLDVPIPGMYGPSADES